MTKQTISLISSLSIFPALRSAIQIVNRQNSLTTTNINCPFIYLCIHSSCTVVSKLTVYNTLPTSDRRQPESSDKQSLVTKRSLLYWLLQDLAKLELCLVLSSPWWCCARPRPQTAVANRLPMPTLYHINHKVGCNSSIPTLRHTTSHTHLRWCYFQKCQSKA
jgi:hypothetical protein